MTKVSVTDNNCCDSECCYLKVVNNEDFCKLYEISLASHQNGLVKNDEYLVFRCDSCLKKD